MTDRRKSLAEQLRKFENQHHEERTYGFHRSGPERLVNPPTSETVTQ